MASRAATFFCFFFVFFLDGKKIIFIRKSYLNQRIIKNVPKNVRVWATNSEDNYTTERCPGKLKYSISKKNGRSGYLNATLIFLF